MILCVNANAAVDQTLIIDDFQLNAIHRPSAELLLPGGKGCNVARVAKALGQQPVVTGWVGGYTGQFIENGLREEGIQTAFVHTKLESRACLSILDTKHGTLTEIYAKGRPVTPQEVEDFYQLYSAQLPFVRLVTLSGSLPAGVPDDFYAILIRSANEAGIPTILDSSGVPLKIGLEAGRPSILKCNRTELSELLGQSLDQVDDVRNSALILSQRLEIAVVITLGATGAVAVERGQTWIGKAPHIETISAVGSGDAFLAGLGCAILAGQPMQEALRLAIAAGAANALEIGAGRLRLADIHALMEKVVITGG